MRKSEEKMLGRLCTSRIRDWFDIRRKLFEIKQEEIYFNAQRLGVAMSALDFLTEFATLNLDFGRQTGKTFFAKWFYEEYKDETFVVFPNYRMRDHFIGRSNDGRLMTLQAFLRGDILAFTHPEGGIRPSPAPTFLLIENHELLADDTIDEIYAMAERVGIVMVILL